MEAIVAEPRMVYRRTDYTDPLQIRCADLMEQRRKIDAELRELKVKMRVGVCERCGKEFTRARVTKRYCSQRCCILGGGAASGRPPVVYDLPAITENIDLLEASGLMTRRSMEILRVLADKRNTHSVADLIGVSHQRVSQIAARASKVVKTLTVMRIAVLREAAQQKQIAEPV